MIGLATQVFDLNGALLLFGTRAESELSEVSRRVSRTATLDGGAVVTDGGYTAADKTLKIVAERVSAETFAAAQYLVRNYGSLMVATDFGLFLGAPESLSLDNTGRLRLTVLVTEELT